MMLARHQRPHAQKSMQAYLSLDVLAGVPFRVQLVDAGELVRGGMTSGLSDATSVSSTGLVQRQVRQTCVHKHGRTPGEG
jgi:hypothetical protein